MEDFTDRFEIIYRKFYDWGSENGFKPSKLAFSRFLGVSQGAIQNWEKGTIPPPNILKKIHDKLNFSYDWLISGEGERFDAAAKKISDQEAEIARLRNILFIEGISDQDGLTGTGNASAGQE